MMVLFIIFVYVVFGFSFLKCIIKLYFIIKFIIGKNCNIYFFLIYDLFFFGWLELVYCGVYLDNVLLWIFCLECIFDLLWNGIMVLDWLLMR